MEKLELKHLAPYLPYGLSIWFTQPEEHKNSFFKLSEKDHKQEMSVVTMMAMVKGNEYYKPILRPLSDLTEEKKTEINKNYGLIYDIEVLDLFSYGKISFWEITYLVMDDLLSEHFDVFGLIEKGLAIDINSLPKEDKEL